MIGAGISGLTAVKKLLDYGVEVDCFESSDRVGGNWAFRNPNGHSSAYRSLHIDTSKEGLRFRDFAISDAYPDFPHHTQVAEYLNLYCDEFGIREHIHFTTKVDKAERLDGGGWQIHTADGRTHDYDVLVVANGHHWDPRYAEFTGSFSGEQIHSHHYIDPTEPLDLKGRRILVVGIGNSAADIVSELSQRSYLNTVFLSTRSGAWVVPKYLMGKPVDQVVATNPRISLKFQRLVARGLAWVLAGSPERYGLPKPNHHFLEAHPTQSAELLFRLGSGDVTPKPDVASLDGEMVTFVDGSSEQVDVIIWATGYNITFPFFDPDFISAPENRIDLYKRMFKPGIEDLVFVGFAQALPTLFPFVECQAGLLARYVVGDYRPPAEDEMHAVIRADHERFLGHMHDSARHRQQLDYHVYEYETRTKEIPQGAKRARELGPVPLVRRVNA